MDNVLNVAKQFINDPEGDYKYLGELEDGKHFVEYMFLTTAWMVMSPCASVDRNVW